MQTDYINFIENKQRKEFPLFICGPCQIESKDELLRQAEAILKIVRDLPIRFVFKSSFDKANRTSLHSPRGAGIDQGLEALRAVKDKFNVPIITDVHLPNQVDLVAESVDILQIPAFLCRQTDLLEAAGRTKKSVLIKKGQFLHPLDILRAAEKVQSAGSEHILLCERGTSFGYRDLIVDMRSYELLKEAMSKSGKSHALIFDATHSTQSLGGDGISSGGNWKQALPLARASLAAGADGIFSECHISPQNAPSDKDAMIPTAQLRHFIEACLEIISHSTLSRFP